MSKNKKDLNEILENDELETTETETGEVKTTEAESEEVKAEEIESEDIEDDDVVEDTIEKKSDKKKSKKDRGIMKFFTSRKFKKGGFSIAVIAVFVAAVIALNMVATLATNKLSVLSFDLSEQQAYNLSQDTIDFIETVNKDITITVLASESDYTSANEYYNMANILLKQFHNYNDKITIEYVDLTANPTYVNKYENEELYGGEYIVSCGDKYRVLTTEEDLFEIGYTSDYSSTEVQGINVEPAVTTAILNVTSENQIKVQFVEGFGEYSADAFKNLLEQNNYEVSTVSTLTEDIASDTQALVLFTPSVDLDETSTQKIKDFLNNNGEYGKNLIYVSSELEIDTPNIDSLLEEWGMKLGKGVVAETDPTKLLSTNSLYVSVADYNNAEYTEGLKDSSLPMVAGYTRPVEITDENTATSMLVTSTTARLVPFGADETFSLDDVEDSQYNVAAVGTKVSGEESIASNVVVFGSALVFDESAIKISSYNNGAYLVNMVNKLTDNQDEGIAIDGKDLTNPALGITTDQIYTWSVICMGVIPVIIIIVAIVIWGRRRNK